MAEVITRFRVNVNGVEQDARVCYQNLANKPTFKTINGKAIIVSSGDTETNFDVATQTDFTALANRVANLEQNGTGGGGGSGTPYDDTELITLITAEQNRATTKEASLQTQINALTTEFNGYTNIADETYATKTELKKKLDTTMFTDFAASVESTKASKTDLNNLVARVEDLEASGGGGGGSGDLSDYLTAQQTSNLIDEKIAAALAAIPVAEGGAY